MQEYSKGFSLESSSTEAYPSSIDVVCTEEGCDHYVRAQRVKEEGNKGAVWKISDNGGAGGHNHEAPWEPVDVGSHPAIMSENARRKEVFVKSGELEPAEDFEVELIPRRSTGGGRGGGGGGRGVYTPPATMSPPERLDMMDIDESTPTPQSHSHVQHPPSTASSTTFSTAPTSRTAGPSTQLNHLIAKIALDNNRQNFLSSPRSNSNDRSSIVSNYANLGLTADTDVTRIGINPQDWVMLLENCDPAEALLFGETVQELGELFRKVTMYEITEEDE